MHSFKDLVEDSRSKTRRNYHIEDVLTLKRQNQAYSERKFSVSFLHNADEEYSEKQHSELMLKKKRECVDYINGWLKRLKPTDQIMLRSIAKDTIEFFIEGNKEHRPIEEHDPELFRKAFYKCIEGNIPYNKIGLHPAERSGVIAAIIFLVNKGFISYTEFSYMPDMSIVEGKL